MKVIVFKKKVVIWSLIGAILVVGLVVALCFSYKADDDKTTTPEKFYGAVVSNGEECAAIGTGILNKGGSAADAAIATLFCEGITCPQSMGLGGGFLATIYNKRTGEIETLNARERAPLASNETMFVNKTNEQLRKSPGLLVAVPGELRGYWNLHQKYGILPWETLVQPTIDLCRKGHLVTNYLAAVLQKREQHILNSPTLGEIFINPETGKVWRVGDRIKRLKLAETLEIVAKEGEDAIYNGGRIGKLLIEDIQKFGGIITDKDLREYEVVWEKPVTVSFDNKYTLYSSPLPGSGSILGFILNVLNGFTPTKDPIIMWHRIIETFKHAYGLRTRLGGDGNSSPEIKELITKMIDPSFGNRIRKLIFDNKTENSYRYYGANFSNPEDHGTANIAVLAPNGDAITVTSTINNILGSLVRSSQTGIILNDEMDDFSTPGKLNSYGIPPSPANFIQPKRHPLSSMCPSIILDREGDARLLIGAAGGSKITTSVALSLIRYLLFNETIDSAVQAKRLHHQLAPMTIQHEEGFDQKILDGLRKIGHKLQPISTEKGFTSLTAIANIFNKNVQPVYDNRRNGSVSLVMKYY